MSQQTIGLGAAPNDGTGDNLRVGGDKINDNFDELYARVPKGQEWLYGFEHVFFPYNISAIAEERFIGNLWNESGSAVTNFDGDATTVHGAKYSTSATQNNAYTIDSSGTLYRMLHCRMFAIWLGRLDSTNVQSRIWFTLTAATAAQMAASDAPAFNFVGFRASISTSANWQAVTGNGSSTTTVDTGVAISTTTTQTFRIEWDTGGSNVRFYIGTALVATISATLPAAGTLFKAVATITNLANDAQVRSMILSVIKLRMGITIPA